jgi:hypothetical protein
VWNTDSAQSARTVRRRRSAAVMSGETNEIASATVQHGPIRPPSTDRVQHGPIRPPSTDLALVEVQCGIAASKDRTSIVCDAFTMALCYRGFLMSLNLHHSTVAAREAPTALAATMVQSPRIRP